MTVISSHNLINLQDDGRILAAIPPEEGEPVIGTDLAMKVEAFFKELEQILADSMPLRFVYGIRFLRCVIT